MTEQPCISDYEQKKPTFELHKAKILQILFSDPSAHSLMGLIDDEVAKRLELKLRQDKLDKGESPVLGRKMPTTDNRLRELAAENRIVRIKGLDGLKHNFHPDVFLRLDWNAMQRFFPQSEIERGKLAAACNLYKQIEEEGSNETQPKK